MGFLPTARNLLKAWLLLVGVCGGLGLAGWWLGGYRLASISIFCAFLAAAAVYWYLDRVALGMVGARELAAAEAPLLRSTVGRLAARAGVTPPRLYLLPDAHPRAFAAGRGPRGSSLALSEGLLSAAPPAELEGILAHELVHVRNRDVLIQTTAAVLAGVLIEMSWLGGWLERVLLFVLGPIAAAFVHLLLSPAREYAADRAAAEICESPHGLADALVRLEQAGSFVEFRASPATEPLYTVNPFAEQGLAAMFITHPPLGRRVRRLRELDPDWRAKLRAA
ncbi:MAG TPA: M48 family metalloprotease [Gaiellaceae bacterium]|nr:M48 family metalloprotease [Gaiellaceae bacterium]